MESGGVNIVECDQDEMFQSMVGVTQSDRTRYENVHIITGLMRELSNREDK